MEGMKGVRERARAEITAEIIAVARRHLATAGAAGLSLRAVARELGMASSGIYRNFASRDDLLTALIVEAYDSLGAKAERASKRAVDHPPAERFLATCRAIRAWARANPHEYALLYGTPVPGYEAPTATIAPATRVSLALLGIVDDAWRAGRLDPPADTPMDVPPALRADLERAGANIGLELPTDVLARSITAWTQVFGLVSFELFGQTRNVITAHADLFDAATLAMAGFIGL
jgi:AcrR family transcriptional regulator